MAERQRNLRASKEYVDELTGTPVGPSVRGGVATGRKLVRVRPDKDAPFELVDVDPDTLDPRRDMYGIEGGTTAYYKQQAAGQAAARGKPRRRKPLTRDSVLDFGRIGAGTTFRTPGDAAKIFMARNESIFEHPLFEDIDAYDLTRSFMDKIEVRIGKHDERLYDTSRGEEILGSGRRAGGTIARQMLTYLMGMTGPNRRWRDVPWSLVDEYVSDLHDALEREASRQRRTPPPRGLSWYPVTSGMYDGVALLQAAVDELGSAPAQEIADWMSSQSLFDLADRLDGILSPPKGPEGAAGRKRLRCIPGADRKMIRHRATVIRDWAGDPRQVPAWACGAEHAIDGVTLCEFPALFEDVQRIEAACQVPYDPGWAEASDEGRYTGLEEAGADLLEAAGEELLDVPWEAAAVANPEHERLARRLASGRAR